MKNLRPATVAIGLALLSSAAAAHEGSGVAGGFASGFAHPIHGLDHVLAMVAVGLWSTVLRRPAIWVLPLVFPLIMAVGGVIGASGLHDPSVEIGIALSAFVLGALIAFAARVPVWIAAAIVGSFAVFHGYAHGVELPQAADPTAYGLGFVLATSLLHATGIAFGLAARRPAGRLAVRAVGAAIAACGVAFLTPML